MPETFIYHEADLQYLMDSLSCLRYSAQADRVYLLKCDNTGFGPDSFVLKIDWPANNDVSAVDFISLKNLPASFNAEFSSVLHKRSEVCEYPGRQADATSTTSIETKDTKSYFTFPLLIQERIYGVIRLERCHSLKEWLETEKELARRFCSLLGMASANDVSPEETPSTSSRDLLAANMVEAPFQSDSEALKNALARLKDAEEKLIYQEKLASIGKLLAGIVHELNSPLGAMRASADNLRSSLLQLFKELIPKTDMHMLKLTCSTADSIDLSNRLSTREERELREFMINELTANYQDISNPSVFSRAVVECGIDPKRRPELVSMILGHTNRDGLLSLLTEMMRVRRAIMTIATSAEKATKVMQGIKNYVHNGTDEFTPVNLNESIRNVMVLYTHQLKHGITDEILVPADATVYGNSEKLSQVWSNIISNAIQAMDNKGHIAINCDEWEAGFVVKISNTGPQIPEDNISLIFEPLFTTKPIGQGSGVGLALVRQILDAHQGKINVDSTPEVTSFTIWLPKYVEQHGAE